MALDRVQRHVAAFNEAVTSGEWAPFVQRFTADGRLTFEGLPVGPFQGREAITAAYREHPPTDTMAASGVDSEGDVDTVRFEWTRGGRGTMWITWRQDAVAELVVAFDDP